ncbi:MAG: VOC family protein [Acidimicrobiia bacterium]|nr:VOC family protein [Acidimicrobiia bacterium]
MPTAFHHVHIKSKTPRDSAAWWVDMFGAVAQPEFDFGTIHFTPVVLDGVTINITGHGPEEAAGFGEPQAIPYWGLEHIGVYVDDMDATLARFEEQGRKVYLRRPGPYNYEIAFADAPDGVVVELLSPLEEG